jgi:pyrroloquinoline quinone (PQQ) biosynthesis protein C
MRAAELMEGVQTQVAPLRERVRNHPYLRALEDSQLGAAQLRPLVGELFLTVSSDLRSLASMVSRFGGCASASYFLDLLDGERAALQALPDLAASVGMGSAELMEYEPLAAAQAYSSYTAWLAAYASDAEIAAAFAVNFRNWSESGGRLGRALRLRYGLSADQAAFFALFADPDERFETRALDVIQAGLDRGVPERLVRRAPRLLQGYELMFWEALYEALHAAAAPSFSGRPGSSGEDADLRE